MTFTKIFWLYYKKDRVPYRQVHPSRWDYLYRMIEDLKVLSWFPPLPLSLIRYYNFIKERKIGLHRAILIFKFNLAGWFGWTPQQRFLPFKWSSRDQHNLCNFLCRDCLLFLSYALQVDVLLVHWDTCGCVLHRWCRGMTSFQPFEFSVGFHVNGTILHCTCYSLELSLPVLFKLHKQTYIGFWPFCVFMLILF